MRREVEGRLEWDESDERGYGMEGRYIAFHGPWRQHLTHP